MGLQIYGNIDAGSLLTGKVQSIDNLSASGIKNLVAGDGLEVELFLTSQTGIVNIQDYSVRLSIGDLNARPTGGTWDLGSTTGLAYNLSAGDLQTAIASESSANTTTELSPFVFKTVFTANGSQTIPTIDATSLTPNSTVSIVKLVEGDGSTQEQWLTRIFRNPIAFQDTWINFTKTGVGNGITGILGLGTPEIYDQFSESVTSFSSTMEMEITDTSGNAITIFQIPVTIGGEVTGAGITASPITPSTFVTATDVNTTIDSVTTQANSLFVSVDRGSDATGTRNSTTKPYRTFATALGDAVDGDAIFFLDGDFSSEGDQTFTTRLDLYLHHGVVLPNIIKNGSSGLRIKGLGALQQLGDGTANPSVDTSGGTSVLIMEKLYAGGVKLSSTGGAGRFDKVDFYSKTEFATGGGSPRYQFSDCILTGQSISEGIFFNDSSALVYLDNCIIGSGLYTTGNAIEITNTTNSPGGVLGIYLKDCLIQAHNSQSAFGRTNASLGVSLNFVGGTTGVSYFPNPSDFSIQGNYICQTNINSLPYLFQQ